MEDPSAASTHHCVTPPSNKIYKTRENPEEDNHIRPAPRADEIRRTCQNEGQRPAAENGPPECKRLSNEMNKSYQQGILRMFSLRVPPRETQKCSDVTPKCSALYALVKSIQRKLTKLNHTQPTLTQLNPTQPNATRQHHLNPLPCNPSQTLSDAT